MKKQTTQMSQSQNDLKEPTDQAWLLPQIPTTVVYNRDTRMQAEQAASSKYVIARAQLVTTRTERFATKAVTQNVYLKDFAIDPDFQDVYTFSVKSTLQSAAADALTQAISALGYTKLYVRTPVHGTANCVLLVGETPAGTQAFLVTLQATTKQAIENFLNLDINVTAYDGWTKGDVAGSLDEN